MPGAFPAGGGHDELAARNIHASLVPIFSNSHCQQQTWCLISEGCEAGAGCASGGCHMSKRRSLWY